MSRARRRHLTADFVGYDFSSTDPAPETRNRFQTSRLGNYTSSDLRELWGIPLLWIQTYFIWRLLAASRYSRRWLMPSLVISTFAFIVSWQFSPFLLLLQATALYFVNIVAGFDCIREVLVKILNSYVLAMGLAVAVHFGSPYLLTSPFFFQLVALKTATSVFWCHRARTYTWSGWICRRTVHVLEGLLAILIFLLVRKLLAPFATADTHVYEILCTKVAAINDVLPSSWHLPASKLPSCAEPGFNANLYLIMGVFKLLEWSSAKVYLESTAAPVAAVACLLVFCRCVANCLMARSRPKKVTQAPELSNQPNGKSDVAEGVRCRRPDNGTRERQEIDTEDVKFDSEEQEDAALLFFVVQSLLFLLLGCLVNRLRVAFGPPMMVLASAVWGTKLFPSTWRSKFPRVLPFFLLFGMAGHLFLMALKLPCISDEEGICQHMADKLSNDGDLADLYDWFNREGLGRSNHQLPLRFGNISVLASMNLAGSMRAFTMVPMIIHPQPSSMCISAVFDFLLLLLLLPHASTVSPLTLVAPICNYSMAAERHSSEEQGLWTGP